MLQKILDFILQHPGCKASEIAAELHYMKSTVNSVLYSAVNCNQYLFIDSSYRWYYKPDIPSMNTISASNEEPDEDNSLEKTTIAPRLLDSPSGILKTKYGYSKFRPYQESIIENVMHGKDSLVLLPTGGGKSVCFQIPALLKPGIALVISPLISLMKDQVESLIEKGIPAAQISSTLKTSEIKEVWDKCRKGEIKLLYMSPEALLREIEENLVGLTFSLIAIDEAHCISMWGHDFRPEYTELKILRERYPQVPIMALTATAIELTKQDILEQLVMTNATQFVSSFDRPNIELNVVRHVPLETKYKYINDMVSEFGRNASGIVYCTKRSQTECVAIELRNRFNLDVRHYHAGMNRKERDEVQELFMSGEISIIVATIAFGMGIDKPDVRWVVHFNLPSTIENYFQEVGRSGRDGQRSKALLIYNESDLDTLRFFANSSGQVELRNKKLDDMIEYASLGSGYREYILSYFGENKEKFDVAAHRAIDKQKKQIEENQYAPAGYLFENPNNGDVYDIWFDADDHIIVTKVSVHRGVYKRLLLGIVDSNTILYTTLLNGRIHEIEEVIMHGGLVNEFVVNRKKADGTMERTIHNFTGKEFTHEKTIQIVKKLREENSDILKSEWNYPVIKKEFHWIARGGGRYLHQGHGDSTKEVAHVSSTSVLWKYIKNNPKHEIVKISPRRIYVVDISDGKYKLLKFTQKGDAVI